MNQSIEEREGEGAAGRGQRHLPTGNGLIPSMNPIESINSNEIATRMRERRVQAAPGAPPPLEYDGGAEPEPPSLAI